MGECGGPRHEQHEGPLPAATPEHLKVFLELGRQMRRELASQRRAGLQSMNVGINPTDLPDPAMQANIMAVMVRSGLVGAFFEKGLLQPWSDGETIDDRVFELAAVWPMEVPGEFELEAFLAALGETHAPRRRVSHL